LTDRFGALPGPAVELLNLVRLRRLACRLAVEKIVVRNETMVLHFISDPDSHFYKSNTFMKLIRLVNENHRRFRVKQTESKLTITAKNVKNIEQAKNILGSIIEAPADN
ncbi:MAG: TRCF domain-containing protein, partial [Bacteroidales bacterium]|nr:TRCF domain-containing protein [Bacteroidales bacterium]